MKPCEKPTLSPTVAHGILTLDRLIKYHKKSGRLKLRKDHLTRAKRGDRAQAASLADSSFTLVRIYCEHKLLPLSLIWRKCLSSFFHSELISERWVNIMQRQLGPLPAGPTLLAYLASLRILNLSPRTRL